MTIGGDWGLVASLVFKTSDTSTRRVVGSIPIRLRHPLGSIWGRYRSMSEERPMSAAPSGFSLTDQNGQARVFPTGRPSLIAFLKEDCNTCNLVAPILEAFHQAWGDQADIWVLGQSKDGNQILQDRHGLTLPVLDDSALKTSFAWGFEIVPAVYWLEAEGQGGPCVEGFVRAEWQALAVEADEARDAKKADRKPPKKRTGKRDRRGKQAAYALAHGQPSGDNAPPPSSHD